MNAMPNGRLPPSVLDRLDRQLARTDEHLTADDSGAEHARQPVHTAYVAADHYHRDTHTNWGSQALALAERLGGLQRLCADLVQSAQADAVAGLVERKLNRQPVEDLRIDFEDGYVGRSDAQEDTDAARTAQEVAHALGTDDAPFAVGVRIKGMDRTARRRGIRTLDLFLAGLLEAVQLPAGLRITLPKVSATSQVSAMAEVCEALEQAHRLPPGRLRFEIQVETAQIILDEDGRSPIAMALRAGAGRVSALHFGTYDYTTGVGIAASHQRLDHPAALYAKRIMQVAVAGTGVELCDGSTNLVPVGTPEAIMAAIRHHAELVSKSLVDGFCQGWDLHPGQLLTRFIATFAFYREGLPRAIARLADYAERVPTDVLDEPATVQALARYLIDAIGCGAVDAHELGVELDVVQLRALASHSPTRIDPPTVPGP